MNKKPTSKRPNTAWLTGWNDGLDALEAEQAQEAEPIGYFCSNPAGDFSYQVSLQAGYPDSVPLYLHPAPPAEAQQVATPYDQQALELCDKCGWKAIMPGEPCFVCNMKTEAQQVAAVTRHMEEQPDGTLIEVEPWVAQQVAVPDGLIDALREASAFIHDVNHGLKPQTRYPLPDELDGFAAILTAQGAKP